MQQKIVIRTTLIEAGHHGGKLFSAEELGKFPQSYDGRYVTLDSGDCNDGTGFARNSVGQIYNTEFDGKALRTELHLERDKLTAGQLALLEKGQFKAIPSVFHEFDGLQAKNIVPNHILLSFPQGGNIMSNCSSKFCVNPKADPEPLLVASLEETLRNAQLPTDKDNIPIERQISDGLPVVDLVEVFKNKLDQEREKAALKAPANTTPKVNEPAGLEVPDLTKALREREGR